jgi:hypothetical protein
VLKSLLERSGSGPYSKMAQAVAVTTRNMEKRGGGSDPQVVVRLVVRAVRARKPKIRYTGGQYARLLMFVRKWMGDRVYDRMVLATTAR